MSETELPRAERVENPFGRHGGPALRTSTGAQAAWSGDRAGVVEPESNVASGVDAGGGDTHCTSDESPARSPNVRRVGVRAPQRLTGLRPITGYEEELLEDASRLANTAALCNEILARCLVPLGEPSERAASRVAQLLVAERDVALVDLRRLTFGERVETDVDCPSCGATSRVSFDLTRVSLEVADVAEALEVTLSDGKVAHLRLPTARDQSDLLDAALANPAERRSWLLERSIHRLGDVEGPLGFGKVHALDSRTRREIERALEGEIPDLDLRVGATCEACAREFAAPFDIASFFLLS